MLGCLCSSWAGAPAASTLVSQRFFCAERLLTQDGCTTPSCSNPDHVKGARVGVVALVYTGTSSSSTAKPAISGIVRSNKIRSSLFLDERQCFATVSSHVARQPVLVIAAVHIQKLPGSSSTINVVLSPSFNGPMRSEFLDQLFRLERFVQIVPTPELSLIVRPKRPAGPRCSPVALCLFSICRLPNLRDGKMFIKDNGAGRHTDDFRNPPALFIHPKQLRVKAAERYLEQIHSKFPSVSVLWDDDQFPGWSKETGIHKQILLREGSAGRRREKVRSLCRGHGSRTWRCRHAVRRKLFCNYQAQAQTALPGLDPASAGYRVVESFLAVLKWLKGPLRGHWPETDTSLPSTVTSVRPDLWM